MFTRLSLRRRGSASDSTTEEANELCDVRVVEIVESREVEGLSEYNRFWSIGSALKNKQSGDTHN